MVTRAHNPRVTLDHRIVLRRLIAEGLMRTATVGRTPLSLVALRPYLEAYERYYEQAFAQLPAVDRKSQRPGLIMAAIYRTLLDEIRRDNFQVLHQRISLPPLRKLWLAAKTWVRG